MHRPSSEEEGEEKWAVEWPSEICSMVTVERSSAEREDGGDAGQALDLTSPG